jgi:phage shock protein A
MTEPTQVVVNETNPRRSFSIAGAIALVAVVLAIGFQIHTYQRFQDMDSGVTKMRAAYDAQLADFQSRAETTSATHLQTIDALKQELAAAKRGSAIGISQAKAAKLHADQLVKGLAEEHLKQQQEVTTELTAVKESATQANAKIADVNTEVGVVKTEVASTKTELEKTISDLKRTNGDMGVMSGLIATNSKELSALKELGDRHYVDFNLTKTKAPQKVGDVLVQLKKVDVKRNRFTIELVADDRRTEKKDRGVNEPVQFYVPSKARQPYEIVVNDVKKDRISGYLAAPKVQIARSN